MSTNQSTLREAIADTILRPVIGLLNRLSYAKKFILIGLALLVPLLFLLRLQYQGTTESLEFNAKERLGVEYLVPANEMLFAVQRRRVLDVAARLGDTAHKAEIAAATGDIENEVARLDEVDRKLGEELGTAARWKQVKAAWVKLRDDATLSAAQSDAGHNGISQGLMELNTQVANASNLILDSDLDSYWLMDAIVFKMPIIVDAIGDTAARGLFKERTTEGAYELAGIEQVLKATVNSVVNENMKTAFAETKNPKYGQSPTLENSLRSPTRDAAQAINEYTDVLRAKLLGGEIAAGPEQFAKLLNVALGAVAAAHKLDSGIAPELDWLVKKRVDRFASLRTDGVRTGLLAVVLLSYIFVGFFVSVRRSARTLALATTKMVAGTEETFAVESRDELGAIAASFNEINAALVQSRKLQRQVESDNQELQTNIMELLHVVSDASDGDLTVRATVTTGAMGNVADAFNSLLESLQNLIGEIDTQLARTNSAIDEIAAASRAMASGATSQTEEVSAATKLVQQISADMQNVSQNAQIASEAARRAQESAKEGTSGVNNVIAGMGTLRTNVQAGAKKMKNLGDRSMEITGIVEAINKISEKTNMLALNAAIEAARAREHGHGFSIVAEEVRKLAEKTAVATEEIERLVKTIHSETADTVEAIEKQTQFVEQESELVSRAGESLARISQVSTESAGLVARISDVTTKQVEGVNRIVKAMDQISTIARSTQSGAEGNARTVEHLASLSGQLVQSLKRFKLQGAANGRVA